MDTESTEVLDLTQMSGGDDLRLATSTNKPSADDSGTASKGSARKVRPSYHNSGSGSPYRADLGNGTTKSTVARLQAVTPQKPAPSRSTPANASSRAVHSPGESSPQGFYRPRISQSVAGINSDSDTAQTSPATPSGVRKRGREDVLTPPSTQASRNTSWKVALDTLAERRRERSFRNSLRCEDIDMDETSPLAKRSKRAGINERETSGHSLFEDARRLDACIAKLLDQGGGPTDTATPSNDTDAAIEAPAVSRPDTIDERGDSRMRLQLSPAQRSQLWNKFTEDPETGSLKFCDCEFHRSSNNEEQRRDRQSGTRSHSKIDDDDQDLSVKTRKCQSCGGAKVKQEKRERFARQWQEIFGRGTESQQQITADLPEAAARPVDLDMSNISGAVNEFGIASGDLGALSAEPTATMDRLIAVNEQLRVATMELIRKQDTELRVLSLRQQAFESEMKEFRTGLKAEVHELKLHMQTTFFSFAEQMSAAIENQGRLADGAGGRRRIRVEDLPLNRMLETAQAFSRRLSDVEEVVEE